MITTLAFNFSTRRDRQIPEADVGAALQEGDYCWIDIHCSSCSASCMTCQPFLLGLGINANAVAEVLGPDREGRYDVHEDCLHFAITEGVIREGRLSTVHVDVVLTDRFLLTYRRQGAEFPRQMRRTCREDFHKFAKSPGFLLYEVGDHLIDSYRHTFRGFSTAVEEVQLRLFADADDGIFRQVACLTQDILSFRKITLASRELMHELASRRSPFISDTTQPFLEKMAETLERLGDDVTTEREGLNESLNLYMGMVSHRTNKVVNRLTVISTIFLPLTFLCGVYGMNFEVMPELGMTYAYPVFWVVAFFIAGMMVFQMKRRKWL